MTWRRPGWREILLIAVAALLSGYFAGWWVSVIALVSFGVAATQLVGPRSLHLVALGLMALVPIAWLLSNLTRIGTVTQALVTEAPWPSVLVVIALVNASAGLYAEVVAGSDHEPLLRSRDRDGQRRTAR